jgi:hypothetical protein
MFTRVCMYQGCWMVYFQTKNSNLGKFWRTLEWKMLIYFTAIVQPLGIFYDHSVIYIVVGALVYFSPH